MRTTPGDRASDRPPYPLIRGLAALALVLAACSSGDDSTATAPTAGTAAVAISEFVYEPATIEVTAGATVTWTNEDMFAHTVTSGEPGDLTGDFDGQLGEVDSVDAAGTTFEHTFTQAGTFAYFCTLHPQMVGTVVVS